MSIQRAMTLALALAALLAAPVRAAAAVVTPPVSDVVRITEEAGTSTTNYPVQFARPFYPGEIPNYPQVLLNGTPVTTQADVKQRWGDGSVKHAILSFYIPTLSAGQTVTVTFQDQASGNNTGYLDGAGMLATPFDFDARMELTNGTTKSASARTMLTDGNFTYWMQGTQATSVVLADHSAAAAYDIGFDAYKPFRPIFHATFFPLTHQVRVRFIGEVANTEALEDVTYTLALKLGASSPSTVYTKGSRTHWAGSRWTKEFWLGGTPPAIKIDHNLAYLETVPGAVPHYDLSHSISSGAIASKYADWTAAAKDIGDAGTMQIAQNIGGDREDIGLQPSWTVRWVYTWDPRAAEEAFGNADLSGSWPVHFREGNPSKFMDLAHTVPGIGHPISIRDRPTMDTRDFSRGNAADQVNVVGPMTDGGWNSSMAHSPNVTSMQYALTGDFFYLEETWFVASKEAAQVVYGPSAGYGRGPTGKEGVLWETQVRANAWGLRDRALAAYWSPDGTPEKPFWTKMMDEAIADHEGRLGITGTPREGNAIWSWAKSVKFDVFGKNMASTFNVDPGLGQSPLHLQWWGGTNSVGLPSQHSISDTLVRNGLSPWMENYLISSFGFVEQMGYDTGPILDFIAPSLIGQMVDPSLHTVPNRNFHIWFLSAYRRPGLMVGGGANSAHWAASWAEEDSAYVADNNIWTTFPPTDVSHIKPFAQNYVAIALTATSMLFSRTDGPAAWGWISGQFLNHAYNDNDPKWAITPTSVTAPPPPPPDTTPPAPPTGLAVGQ
jgi:hypothetical protein